MLQKNKLFIPKQILASKNVLLHKHSDGFAQEIFAKYSIFRNGLAAWFELVYKFDRTYEDYDRADIGQLLINVRMQLQLQEESNKSSLSILGHQALTNFKKQLENTVKTLYSSVGHQSLKDLNERLLKYNIPNSMLFKKAYIIETYKNRPRFLDIYGNHTNIRKGINGFNFKSIKPYNAVNRDLKDAFSLNFNTITGEPNLGSVLRIPTKLVISGDKKGINGFNFKSIKPYPAVKGDLKNAFSLIFNNITGEPNLGSVLRVPTKLKINGDRKGINSFYLKYIRDNIGTIHTIANTNGVDRLYSNIGNYRDNFESIIHMNPYNFRNYYRIYFPGLSSYIGSGFKMADIQGESIKEFSSIIHDKILAGLRHDLPDVLRSAYRLGLFGVNRTKRKQKRELDSATREFWHNMTYNIIQGFRRELESKTNYFFTNHIDKRSYGLSPFLENEGEAEESKNGNWSSHEALTHNKYTSITHFGEQERLRITPQSIYDLRKTYPDIYNVLTFAGLLPTLYVQKHSRETAMGFLSKSIQQYYIRNTNLTVRAYDLLRNKFETEEKSFIWPNAMNNLSNMEFSSVKKAQKSSSYMAEIQALKTQVVNIEKQTLQSVQASSVNVNGLVERIYREIEQRIKVDRVRRGY